MSRWDLSPFSISPVANLMSRCVTAKVVSQDEIGSIFSEPCTVFSPHLEEAVKRIEKQKLLNELQLQLQLLKMDEEIFDFTNIFHLAQMKERLQRLGTHLVGLLKAQSILEQRLMRPFGSASLPVTANMHRVVVECISLLVDFIEGLEDKLKNAHNQATATSCLALLDISSTRTLAAGMQTLFHSIQQWNAAADSSSVAFET